jgi:hypothetical protein
VTQLEVIRETIDGKKEITARRFDAISSKVVFPSPFRGSRRGPLGCRIMAMKGITPMQ